MPQMYKLQRAASAQLLPKMYEMTRAASAQLLGEKCNRKRKPRRCSLSVGCMPGASPSVSPPCSPDVHVEALEGLTAVKRRCSIDLYDAIASSHHEVFLGGSCGETTWRHEIVMPLLDSAMVTFYNPQVDEWHSGLVETEANAKTEASVLLFVVDDSTRALASLVEVAATVSSGKNVVVVVQYIAENTSIAGDLVSENERKDLNRGRHYLVSVIEERMKTHNNVTLCSSISEAADTAAKWAKAARATTCA